MSMKIDKYEKYGSAKYRIYLDNGEVIETYDEVILKNNLLLTGEITPSTYKQIKDDNEIESCYQACLKYISIRIRCTNEIEKYLAKKNLSLENINIIINRLISNNLLDDNYFTECFIKDKLKFTTMGEYKIINELKLNKIDEETISKYSYLFSEEVMLDKINKIVEKKIKANHKLPYDKLRNKLYNYLLGLGYKSNQIVEILNRHFNSTK